MQTNDGPEIGAIEDAWGGYTTLLQQSKLPIRVLLTVPFSQLGTKHCPPPGSRLYGVAEAFGGAPASEEATAATPPRGAPLLSCDRVKIFSDGGLGASTAAVLEPYCDAPAEVVARGEDHGIMQHSAKELKVRDRQQTPVAKNWRYA